MRRVTSVTLGGNSLRLIREGPISHYRRRRGFLGARGPLAAQGCPLTGGGENLAIIDSYYVPPRRRPERTGES